MRGCTVRVLPIAWGQRHHDLVALTRGPAAQGERLRLAFGAGRLQEGATPACQVAIEPDGDVAHAAYRWFDALWEQAALLTIEVVAPYPEWPQMNSSRFEDEWAAYRRTLQVLGRTTSADPSQGMLDEPGLPDPADDVFLFQFGAVDEERAGDEGVSADHDDPERADGEQTNRAVGVPRPPEIDHEIRSLYARGGQVNLDRSEKLPTYRLDAAAALGLPMRSTSDRASVTTPVRLDLLPDEAKSEVESLRRQAGVVLSLHSFLLDKNQHWMPRLVQQHFEHRLDSLSLKVDLAELLDMSVDEYVPQLMPSLLSSLREVLPAATMNVELNDDVQNRLRARVIAYLKAHADINIEVGYSVDGLRFTGGPGESYERPFRLLRLVAVETRRRLADRDLNCKREIDGPPLSALDVVGGDGLLQRERDVEVAIIATSQLDDIKRIVREGASENGCWAFLELLRKNG